MIRHSAHPLIHEINTCVWLNVLGQRYGTDMTLATVPDAEWDIVRWSW